MAIEGVPWMVAGGLHSAEVGRQLAFSATNGETGVILGGSLKVVALPTAGAGVRINAGSASIVSKFPGADGQSYIVRGVGATDISVAKAGTTTTTRYVIIRITDPAYAGQPVPTNPVVGPYAIPEVVGALPAGVPYIALAKIVMPANATTVTNAMITDLRKMANPRQRSYVFMGQPTINQQTISGGSVWPDFRPMVEVPEWATHVSIVASLNSIGHLGGNIDGQMTVTLGAAGPNQIRAVNMGFDEDLPAGAGVRRNYTLGGGGLNSSAGVIPAAFKGTTQPLGTEANRQNGTGYLFTVKGSSVIFQVEFTEDPI